VLRCMPQAPAAPPVPAAPPPDHPGTVLSVSPAPTPPEPARPRPGAGGQSPEKTAAEAPTRFIMRPARQRPVVAALVPAWNE